MDVMGYKMGNIDATIILQKPKVGQRFVFCVKHYMDAVVDVQIN